MKGENAVCRERVNGMENNITMKKYHGLGNDYLVLDPNKNDLELQTRNIERLCWKKAK